MLILVNSCKKDDDTTTDNSLGTKDKNFLVMAAYANRAEVDLAQLALTKTANDSVRLFAGDMVNDHTLGLTGIDSLANQYSVTLPTTIDSMHAVIKMQLMAMSGRAFDSAYIHGQINDHTATINLYQDEATNGVKQNIKDYANRNLPVLRFHLQFADSVAMHLR